MKNRLFCACAHDLIIWSAYQPTSFKKKDTQFSLCGSPRSENMGYNKPFIPGMFILIYHPSSDYLRLEISILAYFRKRAIKRLTQGKYRFIRRTKYISLQKKYKYETEIGQNMCSLTIFN